MSKKSLKTNNQKLKKNRTAKRTRGGWRPSPKSKKSLSKSKKYSKSI